MTEWSLATILTELHKEVEEELARARATLAHPTIKGDASEEAWRRLLSKYLPRRYQVDTAVIVDSKGAFSQQIDVVIFDRQYTPPIFSLGVHTVVPAEAVYGIFEAKQSINAGVVKYAKEKLSSVRRLKRTNMPVPTVNGVVEPRPLVPVLGGILTLGSDWTPPLGTSLLDALATNREEERLDLGCVASHGTFGLRPGASEYVVEVRRNAATAFLLELLARLQERATAPMIDPRAYAANLPR